MGGKSWKLPDVARASAPPPLPPQPQDKTIRNLEGIGLYLLFAALVGDLPFA